MLKGLIMAVIRIAFVIIVWLFILSCAPNVMGNRILDNNDVSHVYLIDDIYNGKSYWCIKHRIMETVEIKNPTVTNKDD
tara:strand:+ start:14 stop:250 length:237 start_codon:yes stop_codon:yes gene_type:complete